MTATNPDAGSLYELLVGELLIDPEQLSAEIKAGIKELGATPSPVIVKTKKVASS